jgi:molybdopterin/thiamine biosynthesis adenylyltransferase
MEGTFVRTVVVGCGGVFSRLALILAENSFCMKDAPKEILLADGDEVEAKNLARQSFLPQDIKRKKAEVWADRLGKRFPDLNVRPMPEFVTSKNIATVIQDGSIVLSAVDNNATRLLLSQHVQTLGNAILISGGNELTDGNVQLFIRLKGDSRNAPIEEVHEEFKNPKDKNPGDISCEERLALPGGEQLAETNMAVALYMARFFRTIITALGKPEEWKEVERGKLFAEVQFDLADFTSCGYKRGAVLR